MVPGQASIAIWGTIGFYFRSFKYLDSKECGCLIMLASVVADTINSRTDAPLNQVLGKQRNRSGAAGVER
ncbi:hypothetical protein L6452_07313 [Arctium lappa]|uniref:Uncharacterized protein n=1 Tax=Arctium lappa TaxID=4217 RepID=A0ACB9ELH0_ARCLA|nr:hypothetical protein L6452_07313 [Arctium lappa]